MHKVSRLASLFLAFCLMWSMLTVSAFAAGSATTHASFMNGTGNGTFAPDRAMTRVEAITVLCRVYGGTDDFSAYAGKGSYVDVPSDNWAAGYVGYAFDKGYLDTVYGRISSIGASKPITRAEFVVLACLFSGSNLRGTSTVGKFTDTEVHWASAYINFASDKGWVNGVGNNKFDPEGSLTRAQICAIVNRMSGRACTYVNASAKFADVSTNHWAYKDIMEATNTHAVN